MSIFDKILGKKTPIKEPIIEVNHDELPLDSIFVEKFKSKGGKFLYTENESEILVFIKNILEENNWESVCCHDNDLQNKLKVVDVINDSKSKVLFTKCEHLIIEDGSILFSSEQLKEERLVHYPLNFIVFATTSQLIRNNDKALSSIKNRYASNIPTNISAIKDYLPNKKDPNFLNYGNNNSKNLYLLLLEDL